VVRSLFQRSHRIGKWGRGIKIILEREPATEFEEVGTALFVARLRKQGLAKEREIGDFPPLRTI